MVVHRLKSTVISWVQVFVLLVSCLVAISPVTAQPNASGQTSRILGGSNAQSGEFPWMVAIVFSDVASAADGQVCGGTLIHERWVLTAAHCLVELELFSRGRDIDVVISQTDLADSSGERISVARRVVHEGFRARAWPDIALLELSQPASATPVLLGERRSFAEAPGRAATVMGWGTTSEGGASSPTLLKTDVSIYTGRDCRASYSADDDGIDIIPKAMLCAGVPAGGRGTCRGDSGGPLVTWDDLDDIYRQVGIASTSKGCARPGFPAVYARSTSYVAWIEETANIDLQTRTPNSALKSIPRVTCSNFVCALDSGRSRSGDSSITARHWDVSALRGGQSIGTGDLQSVQVSESGYYAFTLTVTDANNNRHRKTRYVAVTDETAELNKDVGWFVLPAQGAVVFPSRDGVWSNGGAIWGRILGPDTAQMDLVLQRYNPNTAQWKIVSRTRDPGSRDILRATGAAGLYRWVARSFSGGGGVRVVSRLP